MQGEQDRGGPVGLWETGVPGGYCAEENCDFTYMWTGYLSPGEVGTSEQ